MTFKVTILQVVSHVRKSLQFPGAFVFCEVTVQFSVVASHTAIVPAGDT